MDITYTHHTTTIPVNYDEDYLDQLDIPGEDIRAGGLFDTHSEDDCRALTDPDEYGYFDAYNEDGDRCQYHVDMIIDVRPER